MLPYLILSVNVVPKTIYLFVQWNICVYHFVATSQVAKHLLQLMEFGALIGGGFLCFLANYSIIFWSVIRYRFHREEGEFFLIVLK